MAIEKGLYDLRKKFDPSLHFVLTNRLLLTKWVHYKGGHYLVLGVSWDATDDEWRIRYARADGGPVEFSRTITDWCSQLTVGPRFTEVK